MVGVKCGGGRDGYAGGHGLITEGGRVGAGGAAVEGEVNEVKTYPELPGPVL